MRYLIDTGWTIDHLNESAHAVRLLEELSSQGISISIITYMELFQGIDRSPDKEKALQQLRILMESVPVIPLSLSIARRCARLREQLKLQGKRVDSRSLDLIIAATALEHDLTLVTRNSKDYSDIPNLNLYPAQ